MVRPPEPAAQQNRSPNARPSRGLIALIAALLFLEAVFFTLLAPLVPDLRHQLHLSTAQAGLLVAMYGLGGIAAAIPTTAFAAHANVRATALLGLAIFVATSLLFGFAHSYSLLVIARLGQGIGGVACWTGGMVWLLEVAPVTQRGELVGIGFGVAEAGAILGPVLGGAAAAAGRAPMFAAIAGGSLLLCLPTIRMPAPSTGTRRPLLLRRTLASKRIRTTMWLSAVPATVLGAIGVLGPLQLHRLGAGPGEIAIIFGVAAGAGVLVRPLIGRLSDRRGPLLPIKLGVLLSLPTVLVTPLPGSAWLAATIVIAVLLCIGIFWPPLMSLLSDACIESGASQVTAVAVMNLAWPPGAIVGAAAGGAIAQAAGQPVAYIAMGAMLVAALLALPGLRVSEPEPPTSPASPLPSALSRAPES